ncbi:PhnD/SsuA/transferrin family substrate-binding protein [Vibrio astriarenae]|uniref:histidine kinase n=1 Tax=Vibrio astriarenae TaxID=1481923 RepID=A0A7Z2T1L8_9VIBR|nr:sensor histidine kinase [Vibrio astriarenae]QIA62590.1 PhnD/SsuA/transferrin family substrate-binding protein [Vibrio astriarenae]
MKRYLITLISLFLTLLASASATADDIEHYKVGVLALRGHSHTQEHWRPTLDWLESQIPNSRFHLYTYNFDLLEQEFLEDQLDFVLTSPGQATTLSRQFEVTGLATLKTGFSDNQSRSIASVVLVREESPYASFEDLSRKTMAAVDPKAFGGFLAFFYEIERRNLPASTFFRNISFTGPPTDNIIRSVIRGDIEVGIVPACTYENMLLDGVIEPSNLRVINEQRPYNSSCAVSTPLYPNWTWAKTDQAEDRIGKQVSQALLAMPEDHPAAQALYSIGWTFPVSNTDVDKVYKYLDMHPLQKEWEQRLLELAKRHHYVVIIIVISILAMAGYHLLLTYRFNQNRKKLERSLDELKEKNAVLEHVQRTMIIGELGSSLAHEINQPLSAIKNYSRGLVNFMDRGREVSDLKGTLKKIDQQASSASEIIQRLRALVKRRETEFTLCDPITFIKESMELIESNFRRHSISLSLETIGQPYAAQFDYVGMQQVLLNLLSNASDACQSVASERETLRVKVLLCYDTTNINITVHDNGCGLIASNEEIHSAFFSTKDSGLGLGLSICQDVVEKHGGRLSLSNTTPGCIANVTIPKRDNC